MSIIDILKEEYLYEDEDSTSTQEPEEVEEPNDNLVPVNRVFIIKLSNYLEKIFPSFGDMDNNIYSEIRQYMDETDEKLVKKTKEKIHNMIIKEKIRLLKRIQNNMERFKVPKKG